MSNNLCQDVINVVTIATMTDVIIPVTVSNLEFSDWLISELEDRGWSQSDLARAAGTNPSSISHLINRTRFPGNEICQAIAKAFGYPPEVVFRAAGLLPAPDDLTVQEIKMQHLYKQLTIQEQRTLYAIGLTLKGQREAEE